MRKQIVTLEDHTYLLSVFAQILFIRIDHFIVEQNLSSLNILQSIQAAKQCALAAAGWSDDYDYFAFFHGKINVIQNIYIIIAFA